MHLQPEAELRAALVRDQRERGVRVVDQESRRARRRRLVAQQTQPYVLLKEQESIENKPRLLRILK